MGEASKIAWTHDTFNPWIGCQRVSPGCEHCYAETFDKRVGGGVDPNDPITPSGDTKKSLRWGPTAPRTRTSAKNWRLPLKWNEKARLEGVRRRVFCASLADVFEDRPELAPWRVELFNLIGMTPQLDWLLLTKRPQNVRPMLSEVAKQSAWASLAAFHLFGDPLPNVWFGCTVEDQRRAEERIPELLALPAVVRFLSCEPLLERVDLSAAWLSPNGRTSGRLVDWVIVGGESGHHARPFQLDWAISVVEQCRAVGSAPFVKQLGQNPRDSVGEKIYLRDSHGGDPAEWPEALRVRDFPQVRR